MSNTQAGKQFRSRGGLSLSGARSSLFGAKHKETILPTHNDDVEHGDAQQMALQETQQNAISDEIDNRTEQLRKGVATVKEVIHYIYILHLDNACHSWWIDRSKQAYWHCG